MLNHRSGHRPFHRRLLSLRAALCAFTLAVFAAVGLGAAPVAAQNDLAATLEVLAPGVEVLRVNTTNWIAVTLEAIVGAGDSIRTGPAGRARVTYFANGVDAEIAPSSEYRILGFSTIDIESYTLRTEVVIGQVSQRLNRLLDSGSNYTVETPAMEMVARGTAFVIRVEASGRSAMLVSEGTVGSEAAAPPESAARNADVPAGFGIRAESSLGLSDVVAATTFEQLDAALDGCTAAVSTIGDVSLNVRLGAGLDFPRVGTLDAAQIGRVVGTTEDEAWYRLEFRGGFAWITVDDPQIADDCAGLRVFPDGFGPEDPLRYSELGDPLTLDALGVEPAPTPGT